MINYESPTFEKTDIILEEICAGSGFVPPENPPDTPSNPGWEYGCEYRNHNSGSHSEVAIICKNNGSQSGEGIRMHLTLSGYKLQSVPDSSGYSVSEVTENGFSIFRNGHYNPGERIEFNIQVVVSDSPYHGSIGKTGEYLPCHFKIDSFVPC